MTIRKTNIASAKVTMMWLVTVKGWMPIGGMRPSRFANSTNMKSVKMNGKNFSPAVPAVDRIMSAMNV